MSRVKLILEHMPLPQAAREVSYHGGQFFVGRSEDADWRIDDPDKFVSRKHFLISDEDGALMVTDASTGGLFIDGASEPLGAGNAAALEHGMRLRFGDFVVRVEMTADGKPSVVTAKPAAGGAFDFAFEPAAPESPKQRPKDLPDPFGFKHASDPVAPQPDKPKPPPRPFDDNDPFALDLKPSTPAPRDRAPDAAPQPSGGGYFSDDPEPTDLAPPEPAPQPAPVESPPTEPAPVLARQHAPPLATASDAALRAAFFKGLGLDPARFPGDDPAAEMEALGHRFRALAEGLVHLLRTRAEEKNRSRVSATIIGAGNVNPLKFAVGTDDAVSALVAERGQGYLDPDMAIAESYRDLADHSVRTWNGLQSALRQMIDRFDPAEIEAEMDGTGLLERLAAGGRSAKLWQLYNDRYREIASSAEKRFLGEVGADFRNAYEKDKGR